VFTITPLLELPRKLKLGLMPKFAKYPLVGRMELLRLSNNSSMINPETVCSEVLNPLSTVF
jgi:hypothetical protein